MNIRLLAPGLSDAFLIETLKVFRLIEQFPRCLASAWTVYAPLPRQPVSLRRGLQSGR